MRRIMRVSAAMLALLVAANVAVAQGGGGGGGGARGGRGGGGGGAQQITRLMADITLTADQQTKVDALVTWYDTARTKLPAMTPGTPPDSASQAARTKLTDEFRAKLKEVLTPEQKPTFDKNVETMAAGRGRRGGGH